MKNENISGEQGKALEFVKRFMKMNGYAPSFREIGEYLGVSVGTVQDHIDALVRKRFLKKDPDRSRSLQLVEEENRIPIYAFVKAGSPGVADEEPVDHLTIEGTLGLKSGDRGMLVKGDSMVDAGITNGSIVFYRKTDFVNENAIVIARVGGGPVVKRFSRSGGRIVLKSENPNYKPIVVDKKDDDFEILGKVVSVVKNYEKNKRKQVN
ncbi:MAG TPA: transcriptional repressor LexA [Candidatus Acidoferrales bacterium]|nr:transcriptional repressor LexA [Candidatus Acidoferrales bacterium]